jgi:hypothetical protein
LGTLIKTFKASFLPLFEELSSYLTPMWVSLHPRLQVFSELCHLEEFLYLLLYFFTVFFDEKVDCVLVAPDSGFVFSFLVTYLIFVYH